MNFLKEKKSNYFLTLFIIELVLLFMQGTTIMWALPFEFGRYLVKITQLIALLVLLKPLLIDNISIKKKFYIILLLMVIFLASYNSKEQDMIIYASFIAAALDVDFKQIVRAYFWTELSCLIITATLYIRKIIPSSDIFRDGTVHIRYALGIISPSDFAAHIFYLMIAYILYRGFKIERRHWIIFLAIIILTYIVSDTRLDFALMLLAFFLLVFYDKIIRVLKRLGVPFLLSVIPGFFMAFTLFTWKFNFNPNAHVWATMNHWLSGRLGLGSLAMHRYPMNFTGNFIPQIGMGEMNYSGENYFYIDSSIIRAIMMCGIIFTAIIIMYMLYLVMRAWKFKRYDVILVLILTLISSAIDQHLWEMAYSFILFAGVANINKKNLNKSK